jgi:hypothetical protein
MNWIIGKGRALSDGEVALWAFVGSGAVPRRMNIARQRMEMILVQSTIKESSSGQKNGLPNIVRIFRQPGCLLETL